MESDTWNFKGGTSEKKKTTLYLDEDDWDLIHVMVYLGFVVTHGDVKELAFGTKRMSLKE